MALPIFSFTERHIAEKCKKLTSIDPIALTLMGPCNVILEFDKKDDIMVALTRAHGCHQSDEIEVNIHCIAALKMSLLKIYEDIEKRKRETQMLVREREIHYNKRRNSMKSICQQILNRCQPNWINLIRSWMKYH